MGVGVVTTQLNALKTGEYASDTWSSRAYCHSVNKALAQLEALLAGSLPGVADSTPPALGDAVDTGNQMSTDQPSDVAAESGKVPGRWR